MERLVSYSWPGNVRELQNVIERAVVLSQGPVLELDPELLLASPSGVGSGADEPRAPGGLATLEEMERAHILEALKHTGWVIEGAKGTARMLNLHPNTLRSRMKKLGITRHEIS